MVFKKLILIGVLSVLALGACADSGNKPVISEERPTLAAVEITEEVAAVASTTPTLENTVIPTEITPSVTPTITPSPTPGTPTNTPIMIVAPSATFILPSSTPRPSETPSPTPTPNGRVMEEMGGLRLRLAPSRSGEVLVSLDELTELFVLGKTQDEIWLRVITLAGEEGWVMSQYVETDLAALPILAPETVLLATATSAATITPDIVNPDGYVKAEGTGLRLRSLPSTNADIVAQIPENSPVYIVGRTPDNSWLQVIVPGDQIGWVWAAYIVPNSHINIAALEIPEQAYEPTPEAYTAPVVAASGGISNVTSKSVEIFLRGQALGNHPNTFSKVGDSITDTGLFLYPIGWGNYNLQGYAHFQPVVNYFLSTPIRDGNSFNIISLAAKAYWTSNEVLDPGSVKSGECTPGETPLQCEYRITKPSVALIMIGTNDIGRNSEATYQANLQRIVEISIEMGVIPVLSTIPPRRGAEAEVNRINQIIISTARMYDVPLWDYYTPMLSLPNQGLDSDGVHPSYKDNYFDYEKMTNFTPEALQYGTALRNLMALEVLDAIWRYVIAPNGG